MTSYSQYHHQDISTSILRCPYSECHARIIKPANADVKEITTDVSFVKVADSSTDEDSNKFFIVNDVWDFDNIGVSKPTSQFTGSDYPIERLIICSECDRGPLGFAFFDDDTKDYKNLKYAIHLKSVLYEEKA
jgi:hypothetical protein